MLRRLTNIRTLLYLFFSLVGIVGLCCICFILWSYDYAITYAIKLKSWDVFKALNGGQWFLSYDQASAFQDDPRIAQITTLSFIALGVEVVVIAAVLLVLIFQPFRPRPPKGGAKMATMRDLKKHGFLSGTSGTSILLGRKNGQEIRFTGDAHFFVNGPSRSGKGRGFVMPNLLEWKGSAIVIDAKAENWNYTAAARILLGQKVFFFAPGSANSHRWNALDFVRHWPERATDLQNLAATLVPLSAKEKETIWKETAQALCAGCLGYVLESPLMEGRRHLRSVYRLFAYQGGFPAFCAKVLQEEPDLHPFILDAFKMHLARTEDAQRSFEGNVTAPLKAWGNELVAAATSASDFDIRDLRRTPMTIYIGCSPGDLRSVEVVIRLLIEQVHTLMLLRLPDPKHEPHKVLVILDEFYQFEAMQEIPKRAPIALGYNIIFAVIAQNIPQFDERYTKATRESFLGNMDIRLFIAIGDTLTADLVSESLGDHYVMTESWGRGGGNNRSMSNYRWEAKPLRSNAQLEAMPATKELLYVRGVGGVELDKINFYTDPSYVKLQAGLEKRNVGLPELHLELLAEWPIGEALPSPEVLEQERERKRRAYAGPSLAGGNATGTPDIDTVPRSLTVAASRVYVQPLRLLLLVKEALADSEDVRAASILQTLRLDPGQYGALHHVEEKSGRIATLIGKKASGSKLSAAINHLRTQIIEARRAVVADRARRFSKGETTERIPAHATVPVIHTIDIETVTEQSSSFGGEAKALPSLFGRNGSEDEGHNLGSGPALEGQGNAGDTQADKPGLLGNGDAVREDEKDEAEHSKVEAAAMPESPVEIERFIRKKTGAAAYEATNLSKLFDDLQGSMTGGLKKGRPRKKLGAA